MAFSLGIDFGGGSCKVTLLSDQGKVVASASDEYPSYHPMKMYTEQNPDELYQSCINCISKIKVDYKAELDSVTAIAVDGGTHIAVLLDEKMHLIRNAIYWSDGRSWKESAKLVEDLGSYIESRCFNYPSPTWTLPQLLWLKANEEAAYKKVKKIVFLKDYIRYRLTGIIQTDYIEAMGCLLFDSEKNEWDKKLLEIASLDENMMPKVFDPLTPAGTITKKAAAETGLKMGIKVITGTTDTAMELFASGAVREGDTTLKMATAGRICIVSSAPVVSPFLVTYRHVIPGLWYPGTATKSCASSLRWFRDTFLPTSSYKEIDNMALLSKPGAGGVIFHPYLQGEITPYNNASLRGSFTGVSADSKLNDFARSVLEGVAFSLLDSLKVLSSLGLNTSTTVKALGGGSKSQLWLQIVSDVTSLPLERVLTDDSSIGSAMLAAISSSFFSGFDEAVSAVTVTGSVIQPDKERSKFYSEYTLNYKKIVEALLQVYKEINS